VAWEGEPPCEPKFWVRTEPHPPSGSRCRRCVPRDVAAWEGEPPCEPKNLGSDGASPSRYWGRVEHCCLQLKPTKAGRGRETRGSTSLIGRDFGFRAGKIPAMRFSASLRLTLNLRQTWSRRSFLSAGVQCVAGTSARVECRTQASRRSLGTSSAPIARLAWYSHHFFSLCVSVTSSASAAKRRSVVAFDNDDYSRCERSSES